MATLAENIKFYRKHAKLTQKTLAEKLNIAPTAVSAWELGRNKPLMDNIEHMAQLFGIKKSELLGEDMPSSVLTVPSKKETTPPEAADELVQTINDTAVQLTTPRKETVLEVAISQLEEQEKERTISEPIFEYHVFEKLSAGTGATYWEDKNYDTIYYEENIPHDLASWVYGDSMEPTYQDGSIALIKATGYDYDGAIYAIDWDGQAYIKKVYKEKDGLRLVSLNKKYSDKFAPYTEDPRIIGKVIGNFVPTER